MTNPHRSTPKEVLFYICIHLSRIPVLSIPHKASLSHWQVGIFHFCSWLLEIGLSLVPLYPCAMCELVNLFPNPSSRNLSIPRVLICPSLPKESQKSQQSTPPSVFNCRVLGSGRICNMAISFAWNHRRYDFIESNLRFSLKDKYFV